MEKEERYFREYYQKTFVEVPEISMREFGVGDWDKKIVRRHMAFKTHGELNTYLRTRVPPYISYSVALYRYPGSRNMENKVLLGADLIFEFDLDEMIQECMVNPDHPFCREASDWRKVGGQVWAGERTWDALKSEVFRLIDYLKELGVKEVSVNFSGNRGYHIHVRDPDWREIPPRARREVLDYVSGNFDVRCLFSGARGPTVSDASWRGRLARAFVEILRGAGEEEMRVLFSRAGRLRRKKINDILARREELASRVEKGDYSGFFKDEEKIYRVLEGVKERMRLFLDPQVSVDIRRLIRVPNTLHGGTGLIAKSVKNLEKFDPLLDPVVPWRGEERVYVQEAPEFRLGDDYYGPFKKEEVVLPVPVAMYLVRRGVARWT